MSEKSDVKQNYEEVEIEKEYVELINNAENAKQMTKEEFDKLVKETKESIEFLKLIDTIKLPEEKYVVYTDGEEQLIYENGEFFFSSTTDGTSKKKKIIRKDAINSYIEYFIKYQINPIIKIKEELERKRGKIIGKEPQVKTRMKKKEEKKVEIEEKNKKNTEKEEFTKEERVR